MITDEQIQIQRLQNQVATLEGPMAILMSVLTTYMLSVSTQTYIPVGTAIARIATEIDRRETARLKRG